MARAGEPTCYLSPCIPVLLVYRLVLGLVRWAHVPVESILQPWGVWIVVDLLKRHLPSCERAIRLDEMCLGLGDEPIGECRWDI